MTHQPPMYEFGAFSLDLAEQRLLRDGRAVPLTPKMFELLFVLVQNAGHLVEKERLLKEVWGDAFVEEANLNRGISVLRKALGESSADQKYIETIPKRGYRFVASVRERGNGGESARGSADVGAGPHTAPEAIMPAASVPREVSRCAGWASPEVRFWYWAASWTHF